MKVRVSFVQTLTVIGTAFLICVTGVKQKPDDDNASIGVARIPEGASGANLRDNVLLLRHQSDCRTGSIVDFDTFPFGPNLESYSSRLSGPK